MGPSFAWCPAVPRPAKRTIVEHPIVYGEIGFYQHNGAHTYTRNEMIWVTAWMEKLLPTVHAAK